MVAAVPMASFAQDTPAKILVGFPAGGSFDAIARIVAEKMKTELNRSVIVENKPGAGGRIAVDVLKASPADGSVVMLGPDALTALYPFTFSKLSYDPKKDLVAVGTVAEFPFSMATAIEPKVNTLAEYVVWAKANPNKANYGIPALGAPHHFFGMVLGDTIGVKMVNVPFQGSAPMAMALMGGQISSAIDVMSSMTENHRGGRFVSSPCRRSNACRNCPTCQRLPRPVIPPSPAWASTHSTPPPERLHLPWLRGTRGSPGRLRCRM